VPPSDFTDNEITFFVKWLKIDSTRDSNMLTLSEAIKTRKIQEFIAQQEAAGIPVADAKEFEKSLENIIKGRPQEDQTSRSQRRGGSSGK
jgi:hypothetical protein